MTIRGATVLLVEDDAIVRAFIHDVLDERGCTVIDTEDGRAARRALAAHQGSIDCILLDRGLPDVDGLALLREFKDMPSLRDVPVILETGDADARSIADGIRAGAYFYLTKPLDRTLLLAVAGAAIASARESIAARGGLPSNAGPVGLLTDARFELRTFEEARDLARTLAPLCPNPEGAVLALLELMVNAIEHGNLGIDYAHKTTLVIEGRLQDEIERRLQDPLLGRRRATLVLHRSATEVSVTIKDEGEGFDWNDYLELSPKRMFDPNGRGILIARGSGVDRLEYEGRGNVVTATWRVA